MPTIELAGSDDLPQAITELLHDTHIAAVVVRGLAKQQELTQLGAELSDQGLGTVAAPRGSMVRQLLRPLTSLEPVIQSWWHRLNAEYKSQVLSSINPARDIVPFVRNQHISQHVDALGFGPVVMSLRTDTTHNTRLFYAGRHTSDSTHAMDEQTYARFYKSAGLSDFDNMEPISQHTGDAIFVAGNPFPCTHSVIAQHGLTQALIASYTFARTT